MLNSLTTITPSDLALLKSRVSQATSGQSAERASEQLAVGTVKQEEHDETFDGERALQSSQTPLNVELDQYFGRFSKRRKIFSTPFAAGSDPESGSRQLQARDEMAVER